ncbi:MAG: T9SS type A sorting domain-containing protein [candidate division WOR-3 bacterium]
MKRQLVFDAIDGDDNEYPWYGRIYVSVNSGVPPIQVSSSFGAPDTECFYPTIATGGNYCAVLYCMSKNNSPDSLNRWDFYSVWSMDNGLTWGQPINCTQSLGISAGLPQIAKRIDTTRVRIYYVYCALMLTNADPFWAIWIGLPNDCPARLYLGASSFMGIEETRRQRDGGTKRLEVYPNPFTNHCMIHYALSTMHYAENGVASSQKSVVSMKIYNSAGQLVKQFNHLTNYQSPILWVGDDDSGHKVSSGVYFIHLKTSDGKIFLREKVIKPK